MEPAQRPTPAKRVRARKPCTRARRGGVVTPLEGAFFQSETGRAICVQRFDDSLNSAIRTTYRISLRSSSLREPRYPSAGVVLFEVLCARAPPNARRRRRHDAHHSRDRPPRSRGESPDTPATPPRRRQPSRTDTPRRKATGLATPPGRRRKRARARAPAAALWPPEGASHGRRHACAKPTLRKGVRERIPVMILPQVHLRKPCYDFSFL